MKPCGSGRYGRYSILRITLFVFIVISNLWSLATPLKADTIFTNIVGNCCGGVSVQGLEPGAESVAEAFVPTGQYFLTDARVVVFLVQSGAGGDPFFNVSLFSNASGVPGSLIATIGTDLAAPVGGGTVTASGGMPLLQAGTEYWLVLTPFDSSTQVGWEEGGSTLAPFAFTPSSTGLSGWTSTATNSLQFQIDGTPVPEPASLALISSGAIGLIGVVCRKLMPHISTRP